jgi:mono/diheme cytochrome c family protein
MAAMKLRPSAAAKLAVAGVALVLAAACAAALRRPTAVDVERAAVRWPGTTVADLERGRAIYVRRCSTCHTLYLPTAFAARDWPPIVDTMAKKARLTPAEKADVTRFLATLAGEGGQEAQMGSPGGR